MSTGDWTERFQGTRALPRGVRDRLLKVAQIRNYPKGQEVFGPRNIPDSLLFLLEGTIRVSQTSENGRDIVLYRVDAGESCVLTTACMLAEEAYNAEGLAESRSASSSFRDLPSTPSLPMKRPFAISCSQPIRGG